MTGGNRILQAIVNNWQTSGIVQVQSGQPITITAGSDRSGTALLADRAQWNRIQPYGHGACGARAPCKEYLNPAEFTLPAPGTAGNVVKGAFRGPGYFDVDAGMVRNFPIGESKALQFRADYFNVFNRDNLSNPISAVGSGGFGGITSAISPRIAQFSGKLIF